MAEPSPMSGADAAFLAKFAEKTMVAQGFLPSPPPPAVAEARSASLPTGGEEKDLSALPWSSIDNPESRDLDQIEAVEKVDGGIKLYLGIADVSSCVAPDSALDRFAGHNTTSVYTGVRTFPMLPERLSYDLTSLVAAERRLAVVVETTLADDGTLQAGGVYAAWVVNRAKLDYPSVSAWLEGRGPVPAPLAAEPGLREQVQAQDALARRLAELRARAGALDFDTAETRLVVSDGAVTGLVSRQPSRSETIIEELMVASNHTIAATFEARGLPSIRRVVKEPERWARIVAYAAERGGKLPEAPSALALSGFIERMRAERPDDFAEISLSLIKLIGRGEYVAHLPGGKDDGHFALATDQYSHATAPNRRYVDLVTQRLLRGRAYSYDELSEIAERCSALETAARKVERQVKKTAAALLFKPRIGQSFDAVVSGVNENGTFVRVLEPPIEGMVVSGREGLDVGEKVKVQLVSVNVERGFIDFAAAGT